MHKTVLVAIFIICASFYSFGQNIIIKLNSADENGSKINYLKQRIKNISVKSCSNFHRLKFKKSNQLRSKLNLYYEVEITNQSNRDSILLALQQMTSLVSTCFETPPAESLALPNDVSNETHHLDGAQYFFSKHTFTEAWQIEKGDQSVKIAIVDSGTRLKHQDLVNNVSYNYNDTIDGVNNDNDFGGPNGDSPLVDNMNGWDLADWDNDPSSLSNNNHGTNVAGIAAASTNNIKGGVGAGYLCQFVPYKIASDKTPNSLTHGYQGIIMAAEQGCRIINVSWGNQESDLSASVIEYYQEIIDYVTLDLNCVVIAAAGNTAGAETKWYPASLDHVLSVTAVSLGKTKLNRASYNNQVDLCAQGWNNYTTSSLHDSSYTTFTGTSSAAPVVSGAAALLISKYPELTSDEVSTILIESGEVVDTTIKNNSFRGKMGRYLNPYQALVLADRRTISMKSVTIETQGPFYGNETLALNLETNYTGYDANNIHISVGTEVDWAQSPSNQSIILESDDGNALIHKFLLELNISSSDILDIPLVISYHENGTLIKTEILDISIKVLPLAEAEYFTSNKSKTFIETPIIDELNIHVNNNSIKEICIYDILGNRIVQQKVTEQNGILKIEDIYSVLKTGLYILELKSQDQQFSPIKFYIP